jgi:isopenicillin N synthase-like dioxygenase
MVTVSLRLFWLCALARAGVHTIAGDEVCASSSIPRVDISSFLAPDDSPLAAARDATAAAWDRAMREWGFAQVVGHGLMDSAADALRASALAFFSLSAEHKAAFSPGRYGPEGYTAVGIEAVGRTAAGAPGAPAAASAPPDLVENLVFRGRPPKSATERAARPMLPPSLIDAGLGYWDEMERVLDGVHRCSAHALGQPAALFEEAYAHTDANALRIAHYPASTVPPAPGQLRYGAHTDYQGFTLLWQDPLVAGLQVFKQPADGGGGDDEAGWVDVPAGGLVVNAGDLIELWANGRWRSAMHRVGNGALRERRLSLAFFTGPRHDARIEPLVGQGEPARYEAVNAGEHLQRKLAVSNV